MTAYQKTDPQEYDPGFQEKVHISRHSRKIVLWVFPPCPANQPHQTAPHHRESGNHTAGHTWSLRPGDRHENPKVFQNQSCCDPTLCHSGRFPHGTDKYQLHRVCIIDLPPFPAETRHALTLQGYGNRFSLIQVTCVNS